MNLLFLFELIGTIAFALSGAMTAINRKMDIFGVCILAMTTAIGGGVLRDIVLGVVPPTAFVNPVYALTAIGTAVILFLHATRVIIDRTRYIYDHVLLIMDSIGLGVFTVIGVQTALSVTSESNIFLTLFVGVLTGVGGGVIRDILAGRTPDILIRYVYATASLCGAIVCLMLWNVLGSEAAMSIGAVFITILRILAAKYKWDLPHADNI
ncbi:MAG: TRIC cation channel family protein [Solobacterium sp.]|nr:TRIC cation channel family protein [Solobacterium sp.]